MKKNGLSGQRGAGFLDYLITLALLAGLALAVWKFWSNPENRQSVHPAQDTFNR